MQSSTSCTMLKNLGNANNFYKVIILLILQVYEAKVVPFKTNTS